MTLTYFVRCQGAATRASELDTVLTALRTLEEQPAPARRGQWMHTYALREADGRFGLACLFRADSADALRRHAWLDAQPGHEIAAVQTTWVLRAFAPSRVYLVRRRGIGHGMAPVERRMATARRIAEEDMPQDVTWLHSHVLREPRGALGSACLYQSVDPGALREHARRAGLPADEITPVLGRIVFREDHARQHPAPDRAASA